METSQTTSLEFYKQLKAEGLKKLATVYTSIKDTLNMIRPALAKNDSILDLACGYGRVTIPLALEGYKIQGLDLSETLLKEARHDAVNAGLAIKWRQGDMCALPYRAGTFNKILCLWCSFNHLLYRDDQIAALKEMYRVLGPTGTALVEMFYGEDSDLKSDPAYQPPFYCSNLEGVINRIFVHTERSFMDLLKTADIANSRLVFGTIGTKKRMILWMTK
ncbi:MAG: class I SAM-dependent methyltransferase [Deltaproteobacteria bacterium]|nr:class I SAM-dependent methyltransferase [Deltaproteobacteria bacterium]